MAETETRTPLVRPFDTHATLHWVAVALAGVTGLIHLSLGLANGIAPFVVAGVGFLVGIAVFLSRYWRRWLYLVAAAFALVQVVLWLAAGMRFFAIGVVDKAVQVAFVAVTLYLWRTEGQPGPLAE